MAEVLYRNAEIETTMSSAAVESVLLDVVLHQRGGRVAEGDPAGWQAYRVGSQAAYRLWGIWGRNAWRRLPVAIEVRVVTRPVGALIELNLRSDQGWYAGQLTMVRSVYETAFGSLIDAFERAIAQVADRRPA